MLTDIEIAQKNQMVPVSEVLNKIGMTDDDYDLYGKYKAKITMSELRKLQSKVIDEKKGGKRRILKKFQKKWSRPIFGAARSRKAVIQT